TEKKCAPGGGCVTLPPRGRGGPLPAGPVLPPQRVLDRSRPTALAAVGHPTAGGAFPAAGGPALRAAGTPAAPFWGSGRGYNEPRHDTEPSKERRPCRSERWS